MSLIQKIQYWQFSKSRMEAFSDAVFAIIITLLVLEIKVPHIENHHSTDMMLQALWKLMPRIISWVISFVFLAVIWIQHHNIMLLCKKADYGLLWLNNLLLMAACFLPFPTALAGEYASNQVAVLLLGGILALTSFLLVLLYWYVAKYHLVPEYDPVSMMKNVKRSFFLAPIFIVVATIASFVHIYIPFVVYFLVSFLFLFPLDKPIESSVASNNLATPTEDALENKTDE